VRRTNHLFEQLADRENLRLAVHKALRGKRSKTDARAFIEHLDKNIDKLRGELLSGDVPVGQYHQFTIFDPKRRLITAPCFRERVLHHAIVNVCEPVFERWLIADTFACRRGKGRLAALDRARHFAGGHAFFLKLDIRKYFESVSHSVWLAKLERIFKDRRLLALLSQIIASFHTETGRGIPIGSLTSQHFANFYLGWFDRFVKEGLRVKGYVRYMDDCTLWGDTSQQLDGYLSLLTSFLEDELQLAPKPAPYINRTSHGLDFLGCRVFPRRVELNQRGRLRFRRKLRRIEEAHRAGLLDDAGLQTRATALVAFARAGGVSTYGFRRGVLESMPEGGQ
jgi:retron-type reverse transcriptase